MQQVSRLLLQDGIDTKHHYMRDCSRMLENGESCPNSARAEREVLHLPAYPGLSTAQIERVADKTLQTVSRLDGG
jgi:dTDP-4-amino-4,6-dideoxygalactose transaminase